MNRLRFILQLVDKISGPARRASRSMKGLRGNMAGTANASRRAGASMRKVAAAGRQAGIGARQAGRGARQAKNDLDAASRSAKGLSSGLFSVSGSLSLASSNLRTIAGAGASVLMAPIKNAVDFEYAMSRVGALSNSTGETFKAQTKVARELGKTTIFTATQAAEGMGYLAMAGFSAEKQMQALPAVLELAAAAGMDLGRTAEISSNIMGAFGIKADQMREAGDILVSTFTNSNTTLETLGETMKYAGPQAKAAGVSLKEVAKFAGLLGNAGIDGSLAGTALRTILLRLSAPPKKAAKALAKLGLVTKDAAGNLRAPVDILREMSAALEGMGSADKLKAIDAIFGRYASSGVAEVLDKLGSGGLEAGIVGFDEMSKKIEAADGSLARINKRMTNNRYGKLKELGSAFEDLKIAFGDAFGDDLIRGIEVAKGMIKSTRAWVDANPKLASGLMRLTAGITAIAGALASLAAVMSAFMFVAGALTKPFKAISNMFGGGGPKGPTDSMGNPIKKPGVGPKIANGARTAARGGLKGGVAGLGIFALDALLQTDTARGKGTWLENLSWLYNREQFDETFNNKPKLSKNAQQMMASMQGVKGGDRNVTVNFNGVNPNDPQENIRLIKRAERIADERAELAGAF